MRTVKMIFAALVVVSASNAFAGDLPCNRQSKVGISASTNPKVAVQSQSTTVRASQNNSK